MVVVKNSPPPGCYRRKDSGVKPGQLLCGGDFVDHRLRGGARVGGGENWPAHDEKIGARANRFPRRSFTRLIVGGRL